MNDKTGEPMDSMTTIESGEQSSHSGGLNQMAGATRTLYFHNGTHKTGSTALQVYLEANKQPLGKNGVSYSCLSNKNLLLGNGQYLFDQLYEHNLSSLKLEELLEFYLAGRTVGICSSEDFAKFASREWMQVKDACQRLNVQPKFVIFVRDIVPYYFSVYGQLIKSGGSLTSFEVFCKQDQYVDISDSLKCLLELFGRDSMSVTHYVSAIGHMDTAFMVVIGLAAEQYVSSPLQQPVNRSLTEYEQEILSRFNQATGQAYSLELSVFLMNQCPHLKPVKQFNPDLVEILKDRHAADVNWLNQAFFVGRGAVKINGNAQGNSAGNALSDQDKQSIDRDVANWCILKLQSDRDLSMQYMLNRLRQVDWKNAEHTDIPDEFDPIAYLILNQDIFLSVADPFQHFVRYGQREGRSYKFLKKNADTSADSIPSNMAISLERALAVTAVEDVEALHWHIDVLNPDNPLAELKYSERVEAWRVSNGIH